MSGSSSPESVIPDPDRRRAEPGWFEEWKAARAEDNERLDRIEGATNRLREDAAALNTALTTLATKDEVQEKTVSKDEHASAQAAQTAKAIAAFARIRLQAFVVGVVFFVLSLVALGTGLYLMYGALDRIDAERRTECLTRVENSKRALGNFNTLLQTDTVRNDPAFSAFVQTLRDSTLRNSQVQC